MTFATFERQMKRLQGLRFVPSTLQTHWESLRDLEEAVLAAAIDKARDESGDFPSPKMLKIYAEHVRPRLVPVPPEVLRFGELRAEKIPLTYANAKFTLTPSEKVWKYYCDDCEDSGWVTFWCGESLPTAHPWIPTKHCGSIKDRVRQGHYEHEWTDKCPCREKNPDVKRRLERHRQSGRRGDNE